MLMYKYKCDTGKGNINSLKPDRALQTSLMPRRSPGMLQGWRQRTDGSEGRYQVCGSNTQLYRVINLQWSTLQIYI